MTPLRIAGAQIPVSSDIETNVAEISQAIDFASQAKADILLTPEGSLSGYTHLFDAQQAADALRRVTARAAAAHVGLALGTCFIEPDDLKCYNQVRFYAPDGTFLGFHNKTLTTGSMTQPPVGEINHYAVRPLRTFEFQGLRVGGLICNDLWANPMCTQMPDPHLTQQLSEMEARVIFHAVNGGRDASEWAEINWHFHESSLRMRAAAGKLWIVTVDNCAPLDLRCSAPSGVVAPDGRWVCRAAPVGRDYFVAAIDC